MMAYEEIKRKIENPWRGLKAVRFVAENTLTLTFRRFDIAKLKIPYMDFIYELPPVAPELTQYLYAKQGAFIKLFPEADKANRYDIGHSDVITALPQKKDKLGTEISLHEYF